MAPRETPKATPKVQRTIVKTASKLRSTPTSTVKKTMSTKKTGDKIPLKGNIVIYLSDPRIVKHVGHIYLFIYLGINIRTT